MANTLPIQEKTLEPEYVEKFFRTVTNKIEDVTTASTDLLIEDADQNAAKIIEAINDSDGIGSSGALFDRSPSKPSKNQFGGDNSRDKDDGDLDRIDKIGKFLNDTLFGSLGLGGIGDKIWKMRDLGVKDAKEQSEQLDKLETPWSPSTIEEIQETPLQETQETPLQEPRDPSLPFSNFLQPEPVPLVKTTDDEIDKEEVRENVKETPSILEEIKIESVQQTPLLEQLLDANVVDGETLHEESVKWDREIGILEDIRDILLDGNSIDKNSSDEGSSDSGGFFSGLLGGMLASMGAAIMAAVGGAFTVATILPLIAKFFGAGLIVASLGKGIYDGFKNYQEEGHLATAIATGIKGMVETATLGLFDFDKQAQAGRDNQEALINEMTAGPTSISESGIVKGGVKLLEAVGLKEAKLPETLEEVDATIQQKKEEIGNLGPANRTGRVKLTEEIDKLEQHRETLQLDTIRTHEIDTPQSGSESIIWREMAEQKSTNALSTSERVEKLDTMTSHSSVDINKLAEQTAERINVKVITQPGTSQSPEFMGLPFTHLLPNRDPSLGRYVEK